jgi:hypothetical protein
MIMSRGIRIEALLRITGQHVSTNFTNSPLILAVTVAFRWGLVRCLTTAQEPTLEEAVVDRSLLAHP